MLKGRLTISTQSLKAPGNTCACLVLQVSPHLFSDRGGLSAMYSLFAARR